MKGTYILEQVKDSVLEQVKRLSSGVSKTFILHHLKINKEQNRPQLLKVTDAIVSLQAEGTIRARKFGNTVVYQYINPDKVMSMA